jgi:hypothetical protein
MKLLEEILYAPLRLRLLKHSNQMENGCIVWSGRVNKDGYGLIRIGALGSKAGRQVYVHRLAAALWNGFDLASPMFILHRCDNPPCWNPEHLFEGTNTDNVRDCIKKGRRRDKRGEENINSKLTYAQVVEIRKAVGDGATQTRVARDYGVSGNTISRIVRHVRYIYAPTGT